jgi:hypothetical protein
MLQGACHRVDVRDVALGSDVHSQDGKRDAARRRCRFQRFPFVNGSEEGSPAAGAPVDADAPRHECRRRRVGEMPTGRPSTA